MPLYICNTKQDALSSDAKQQIAQDITSIHCKVTGAPALFVHVAFFEEAAQFPIEDKTLFVRGTIRKGRSDDKKAKIAEEIEASLQKHGGLSKEQVSALIRETPASWVLEGGEIMPEPGDEAEWFAAQEAKHKQAEVS